MKILNHKSLYENTSDEWKNSVIEEVCKDIIENFFANEKVVISHGLDPEWDCSGYAKHTNEKYKISNYKTFGDFLEEYNGVSEATYYSGCGLYWKTYKDEAEENIRQINYKYTSEMVASELGLKNYRNMGGYINIKLTPVEQKNNDFLQDYYDEFDHELHDELVFALEYELIDMLEKLENEPFAKMILKYTDKKGLLSDQTEVVPAECFSSANANNENFKK